MQLKRARARKVKVSQKAKEKMEMERTATPCQPRAKAKASEAAVVPKEKERAKEKVKERAAAILLAKEARVKARDQTVLLEIGAQNHVFIFQRVSALEAETVLILMTELLQPPLKDTPNRRRKLKQRPRQQQQSLYQLF